MRARGRWRIEKARDRNEAAKRAGRIGRLNVRELAERPPSGKRTRSMAARTTEAREDALAVADERANTLATIEPSRAERQSEG